MSKYKFRNKADYRFFVPELTGVWLREDYFTCYNGYTCIKKDYRWNGCTLAPDTAKTRIASMVHDSLYQYGKRLGLKRKIADRWFVYLLKKEAFKWYWLYYAGVRLFGWLFY